MKHMWVLKTALLGVLFGLVVGCSDSNKAPVYKDTSGVQLKERPIPGAPGGGAK